MNDENDREQWFVEWFADGKHWYQCPDDFIRVQYEMAGYHKATADEIFDWWVSNQPANKYFGMLRSQLKLKL